MGAELTLEQARAALLRAQGLASPPRKRAKKADVLAAIQRMRALQIDTIHVVARSPYFVLWSRLGEYEPRWLDELLRERKLFEYWAHAACFLPIEDYGIYRRRMLEPSGSRMKWLERWLEGRRDRADVMLAHMRMNGPVRSVEFSRPNGEKGGGWWSWKDEKVVLELLFDVGELMIRERQNFQRVYDLRERVLPDWDDSIAPSREESDRQAVLHAAKALGVAKPAWIANYLHLGLPTRPVVNVVHDLVKAGELCEVGVKGWTAPGIVHAENTETLGETPSKRLTTLLSPFDPITWDRARAQELFGFDYRIECYTPAPKRVYGYFSLPILHAGRLVGRLDAKAHRSQGVFEVKTLHLEPDVKVTAGLVEGVRGALDRCAAWHKTPEVVVRWTNREGLAERFGRE